MARRTAVPEVAAPVKTGQASRRLTPTHAQTLTSDQAAAEIGTTVRTIHKWLHAGKIRGVKPGGDKMGWRIPRSEVDRILGTPST